MTKLGSHTINFDYTSVKRVALKQRDDEAALNIQTRHALD